MRNILIVAAIYFGLFVITMCTLQDVSAHQFNEEQCGWAAMLMREYTQEKILGIPQEKIEISVGHLRDTYTFLDQEDVDWIIQQVEMIYHTDTTPDRKQEQSNIPALSNINNP